MSSAKENYAVVPLSPRTGKPLKRVRKKQQVIYGVRGPRGGVRVIRPEPQVYYRTDLEGLNQQIQETAGGNFVVYEQKLRGKKTKITYAQPRRKQKPLLYIRGKRARALDIGHKTGNYKKARQMRGITVVKPGAIKPLEIVLKGRTIKQALSGFHLDINESDFKGRKKIFGLYYSVIIIIRAPDGTITKIPVNTSFRSDGFPTGAHEFMKIPGFPDRQPAMRNQLLNQNKKFILANLHGHMAYSIRQALKDGGGYRFTSLTTLKQIEDREEKRIDKMRAADVDQDIIDRAENSADGIRRLGIATYASDLKQLTKNYTVILYIKFEKM